MDAKSFFGTITLISSMTFITIGLVAQIIKQHYEQKCGLSIWLIVPALLVYVSRFCYDITISSLFLMIPDGIGSVLNGIVLYQYFRYPQKKEELDYEFW